MLDPQDGTEDYDVNPDYVPPVTAPLKRYRNSYWTGDINMSSTRVHTRHYDRPQEAWRDAEHLAHHGHTVVMEKWLRSNPQDALNQGWGMYDMLPSPTQRPALTPYDTGERLEPKRWRERPEQPGDYGKVDFEDEESKTVATVHIESDGGDGYRLVIETDYEFTSVVFNGEES